MTSPSHGEGLVFESRRAHVIRKSACLRYQKAGTLFSDNRFPRRQLWLTWLWFTVFWPSGPGENFGINTIIRQNTAKYSHFQWKQRGIHIPLKFLNRLHMHCTHIFFGNRISRKTGMQIGCTSGRPLRRTLNTSILQAAQETVPSGKFYGSRQGRIFPACPTANKQKGGLLMRSSYWLLRRIRLCQCST